MNSELIQSLSEGHQRWRAEDANLPIADVIERISILTHNLALFWSECSGWAPDDVAHLLSESRLDRIASLASCLGRWCRSEEISDGELIIAWTTLGGVLEGSIKLFLCVYLVDYRADNVAKKTRAFHVKKQILQNPDGLTLEILLSYTNQAELLPPEQVVVSRLIQQRRNAIHAFRNRELGTVEELHAAIREFRLMLRSLHSRLPYPDRYQTPSEHHRLD